MAIVKRKRKDGSIGHQVKVKDPAGQWYESPTFGDELDAQEFELELKKRKQKGTAAFSREGKFLTELEYWEVWEKANRDSVSAGWKLSQNQMHKDYIAPVLGGMKMFEIKKPDIGAVLARMRRMGRGEQMVEHVYSLLRTMFRDAVEYYEMLAVSPVVARFHRPKVPRADREFLSPAQAFELMDYVRYRANPKVRYLARPIWVGLLSGLRIGEIQALETPALDFELNQIQIRAAYNKKVKVIQHYPKGKNWTYVPMAPMLKGYLLEENLEPGLVVRNRNGGMLSYETFEDALKRLCKGAGVPIMAPHELRHSCTQIWEAAGAAERDLQLLLNHASPASTRRYMHRSDTRLTAIGGKIGQLTVIEGGQSFPKSFPNGKFPTCVSPQDEAADA